MLEQAVEKGVEGCLFGGIEVRDERGEFLVDQEMKPIAKATKCDLCVENHGGPACERACPHGALTRMNLNNLDALSKWLKL